MEKKNTADMLEELQKSSTLSEYLTENKDHFNNTPLSVYLTGLLEEKKLSKIQAITRAELNEIYGYQIFSGTRRPSRDRLLCLAFGMALSLDETQALLKIAQMPTLYAKDRRDSHIIFGLTNGMDIFKINQTLFDANLNTLN